MRITATVTVKTGYPTPTEVVEISPVTDISVEQGPAGRDLIIRTAAAGQFQAQSVESTIRYDAHQWAALTLVNE